jgi:uncharacterized protein YjbI with pentapeptide repeats
LVAAPSAVLTWYWRTAHKKRDLELTHAEERNVRFATAVQLLEAEAAGAIFALERLTKESPEDHWQVMQTLAAAIRGWSGPGQRIDKIHQDGVRFQALVDALGRREIAHDPPGAVINLSGARLGELNFRGLDFTGACFDDATISRADLRGTNLIGASFANAKAVGAWIDDDTKLDDLATMTLQHAGARFDTLAIRKMQEFIDRDSAKAIADRDALLKGLVDQAKKP